MPENHVKNIRPNATFAAYQPQTAEQQKALEYTRGLAEYLVSISAEFNANSSPFADAMMIVLAGAPGTGKSHLLEAIANHVAKEAPPVLDHV